jgi:hypothetical protein
VIKSTPYFLSRRDGCSAGHPIVIAWALRSSCVFYLSIAKNMGQQVLRRPATTMKKERAAKRGLVRETYAS